MLDHFMPKVVIIDYKMGNLFSVRQACSFVGLEPIVSDEKEEIMRADGLILPGVGAFGDAMNQLKQLRLIEVIKDFVACGKPFLGICLGLQLLMSESEEFGSYKGLGIIPGCVTKLNPKHDPGYISKVPEVGWNQINPPDQLDHVFWDNTPLKGIRPGEYMYFVHSFYVQPDRKDIILSQTAYEGVLFCSSIQRGNVFAVQFHPEKSAYYGIQIYRNWCSMIKRQKEKMICPLK